MKRYWKILTLCLITVVVIGAFYIQSSFADENIVIEFEKISGNEREVENLVVNADYIVDDVYQPLFISNEETINLSDQSVFQELTRLHGGPGIKQLIEKYGSFMRGKYLFLSYFYEDDNFLAYAKVEGKSINAPIKNSYLDVDVLDKKTENTTSMKLDIPNKENYSWLDIIDIQMVDDQLKVIANGRKTNGEVDLNVYTIDIEEKQIAANEVIDWSEYRMLNEDYSSQPQRYILFKEELEEDSQDMNTGTHMIYEIENNQTKELMMDKENLENIQSYSIFRSTLFILNPTEDALEVHQYDIETEKWEQKQLFDNVSSENDDNVSYVNLLHGKVYIINSTTDGHTLSIFDAKTAESLYEGKLKLKNQTGNKKDYEMYFYDIEVSQ